VELDDLALNPALEGYEGLWLKALLQATDYGVLLSDLDRQDLAANRRLGELFALDPHRLVSSSPDESRAVGRQRFAAPEEFERRVEEIYRDPFLACAEELQLAGEPGRVVRRATMPVCTPAGDPIGRLWTFQDITETRRLQAALQEQLAWRTEDLRTTNQVLQAVHCVGRLARAPMSTARLMEGISAALSTLLGFNACALLLTTPDGGLAGVIHRASSSAPQRWELHDSELISQIAMGGVNAIRLPHGVEPPCVVDGECLPIPVLSGGQLQGILFFFDTVQASEQRAHRFAHLPAVADHVALALETHRLQDELRTAITELQAAQQQMVQAERLGTAGTLAATIAHDIQNILAPLQLELAQTDPANLEEVRLHLQRFSTLTRRLISFAHPGPLDYSTISLPELASRVLPLIAAQGELTGVQIERVFANDLPVIRGDANQLEQLVLNLCLNAIHAMAETGGALRLGAFSQEGWLCVEVADTGPGISPSIHPRLFEPFFTTRPAGVGLGLFSCKRVAEEHGGHITAENRESGGAIFRVWLPSRPPTP